jgi:pyruvate/2-oxoglutarate/acetoin dehydrogenase E1 component
MNTVLDALNAALHRACAADDRVVILGEDILDPYGGAFKVTRGLSTAYPQRVFPTPISEAGITGVAAGMALRGLRPVVEIMFGDFITLAADQLINHAAKFRWMYNDQVRVPLVIRTPMGGRRGYGPTHSQTLEKLFLGVPGLNVLAPAAIGDPGELLFRAIMETENPLLFVENKLLYLQPVADSTSLAEFAIQQTHSGETPPAPVYALTIQGAPPAELTIAGYGYMAELVRQAMLRLAYEHEIFVELVVPSRLAPIDILPIVESAGRTGRLLTVEEGTLSLGWGSELLARCSEALGGRLGQARRLAAAEVPVPASGPLEAAVLPGVEEIIQAARLLVVR